MMAASNIKAASMQIPRMKEQIDLRVSFMMMTQDQTQRPPRSLYQNRRRLATVGQRSRRERCRTIKRHDQMLVDRFASHEERFLLVTASSRRQRLKPELQGR